MKDSVSVFAPASIGNLSVGFDMLGLAVQSTEKQLGDVVKVEKSTNSEFLIEGEFAHVLPSNCEENLVLKAHKLFTEFVPESKEQELKITLQKNLPICSGLGSSASSVVAACAAFNALYESPLSPSRLLELMGQCEASASGSVHYDNIAPSFLGGLQLCSVNSSITHNLPWPDEWQVILAYPDIDIPTSMARDILPDSYSKHTTIRQMNYMAKFVHALHSNDRKLAANALIDVLAEPYRAELLPNFIDVKQALLNDFNVEAVGISGSGPTLFAVIDNSVNSKEVLEFLDSNYVNTVDIESKYGFSLLADINREGVKIS